LRRQLMQLLQQAVASPAAAAAAKERAAAALSPSAASSTRQVPTSDLLSIMMGRAGGPPSPPPAPTSNGPRNAGSQAATPALPELKGPSVAAAVTCDTGKDGTTTLPAATRRGASSTPAVVRCSFTAVLPQGASLQTTGRIQVVVTAAPAEARAGGRSGGAAAAGSTGRVRTEEPFTMQGR
jgi:hypothetical protein